MISGGAKFFSKNKAWLKDGATIDATNSDASADRMIDNNPFTYYRSVASSDAETITITVTLPASTAFNRLHLIDHNWKSFNIKYLSGGSFVHFASVTSLDGSMANITETTYARNVSYYEFTEVTTTQVQIQVTTTQVANAQKYCNKLILSSELGTMEGYPSIKGTMHSRNVRTQKMLSGKVLSLKSEESFAVNFDFKDYPARLSNDIDLMFSLYDKEDPFQIWICGGRYGSEYFTKQMKGYRLQDIYQVQANKEIKPIYSDNVYKNQVNFSVEFLEAVD